MDINKQLASLDERKAMASMLTGGLLAMSCYGMLPMLLCALLVAGVWGWQLSEARRR